MALEGSLYQRILPARRRVSAEWNRRVAYGNGDSDPMNGLGKPGAREPHARFDEGRLETEPWSRDRSACNEVRGQRRTTKRPPRQSPTLPPCRRSTHAAGMSSTACTTYRSAPIDAVAMIP